MNDYRADLITYRLERADALLQTCRNLVDDRDWFSLANRLYYAVYQAISALLVHNAIPVNSHTGAKAMFDLHFVKTNKAEVKWSKLYTRLSDARHSSDYGAFIEFTPDDVLPLLPQTEAFIDLIKGMISSDSAPTNVPEP